MAVSRVRPTFIAFQTDDEDSEIAWDEYEAFLQILADFSPGGECMVHHEGAAFLASTRTQLLKQELRASARRVIFHALHHVLGPAAWRASRNHVLIILIGCEGTPADGMPAPRYDYGEMMNYDEAARIIAVAMDEYPSVYLQTNEGDPYAELRWLPNYKRHGSLKFHGGEAWGRGVQGAFGVYSGCILPYLVVSSLSRPRGLLFASCCLLFWRVFVRSLREHAGFKEGSLRRLRSFILAIFASKDGRRS
jgi:hypothetical protein